MKGRAACGTALRPGRPDLLPPAQRVADGQTEPVQPAGGVALPYDTPRTSTRGQRGRNFSCVVPVGKIQTTRMVTQQT